SKGDKISEGDLTKIDQKFNQLLSQMPKPMAMANVGAFNCDGAAWIGALILRDVLNMPVRIAGGRTSAGTKTVNQEKLHVVKSSDPAHAWVEVFDGKHWVPFDMTPKNNTPESQSSPIDVEREESKPAVPGQKQPPKDKSQPSKGKGEGAEKKEADKDGAKDDDKNDKKDGKDSKDKDQQGKQDGKPKKETSQDQDGEGAPGTKKIDDLINAKSTQRRRGEQNQALIDRVIKRNELMLLEHLIHEGHQTPFQTEANAVLDTLNENSNWKNTVERSRGKIATFIHDSKFAKFGGLQGFLTDVRVEFSQNNAREAKQKLMIVQRLLLALGEYRSLTKLETESLHSIEAIIRSLDQIKHENSKEFDAVQDLLKSLPGNISKNWLAKQYGKDYDQLGSSANVRLAQDIVSGKLKPLLQMGAVSEFVDMTLDSTPEPQWKDEPTLNRSLVPKPRQDLIITRSPLDFAKMLWSLRPGEHMFAPTLQGRQFAIGSLETRRVVNPKNPLEKKVSVIYYDVSPSMNGRPIESQDALLMAFVDKALSETDAIGRPTHEIYLIPFNDNLLQGVHVAAREDAQNFLARRMNMRTQTSGSTDIQKAVENFYDIIGTSYRNKSAQGRDKLFQKANMVLFTDGGSAINMEQLEAKRKTIPKDVLINMNFVSIGDQVNETLKTLSENARLSSSKPTFRKMDSQMIDSVGNISAEYNPDAFATTQRISGQMLAEINRLLQKISVDTRQKGDPSQIDRALSQLQITKTDVSQLPGIREALNLTQLETAMNSLKLDPQAKQRLVESIVESYQQLTGRSWREMTYPEKDALEKLRAWVRQ
ncbi:MAG: VWA domain-containing protein, partial [Pseudomonadota bacterium]|nr:VWA domain-containing protein [Pseudomonadota bacterium]